VANHETITAFGHLRGDSQRYSNHLAMSTPRILHRLYSLDPSSLDFSRQLYCLIRHDEREQYLTGLQGPELAQLVDFLDEVRALP